MKKVPGYFMAVAVCIVTATLLMVGCYPQGEDKIEPAWARVEIDGIPTAGPFLIIQGPGYHIERVEGFDRSGNHDDTPGLSTEYDFIFEAEPDDATELRDYFDAYLADPMGTPAKNGSMIVLQLNRSEAFRWNFRDFVPAGSYTSSNGRTRFILQNSRPPDLTPAWDIPGDDDPFGTSSSYNPSTDRLVEIEGVSTIHFQFREDRANRTVMLTFVLEEGNGIWTWVRNTVQGAYDFRDMSLIRTNTEGHEVSRRNFWDCFPIRYEQSAGFDLDTRVRARVILSYNQAMEF